jgi:hypothetical protein
MREIDVAETPYPTFVWFKTQGLQHDPRPPEFPNAEQAYHTTLVIGHLVIDVYGLRRPLILQADHGDGLMPIWPDIASGAIWPPPRRFRLGDDLVLV